MACIAYSGLRKTEVLRLQWDWIDFGRGHVIVTPSKDWHPKNYKARKIPLNEELAEALRRTPRRLGSPYVFPTPEGKPYKGVYYIQKALNSASKQAGIPEGKVGFHQLRAAFCSHAQLQGIAPLIVKEWMGHRDLTTTLRYSHTSPDHERCAMESFRYENRHQEGTGTDGHNRKSPP